MLVEDYTEAQRALSVRRLRALADLFKLTEGSVASSVAILLEAPCEHVTAPSWSGDVAASVTAWIDQGEKPPMAEELGRIFGAGFCECALPTVPACAAFYVSDADTTRAQLLALYERMGYVTHGLAGGCAGTSYISHQLEFLALLIEQSPDRPEILEEALPVMRDSLFEWAGLFARAVVSSSRHPGAVFAGLTLECVLQSDPVVSALVR